MTMVSINVLDHAGLRGELGELADVVRKMLEASSVGEESTGAEHGWFGIGLLEELGGAGGNWQDLAVVAEAVAAAGSGSAVGWTAGVVGALFSRYGHAAAVEAIAEGAVVTVPVGDIRAIAADSRDDAGAWRTGFIGLGSSEGLIAVPFLDAGVPALALMSEGVSTTRVDGFDRTREYSDVRVAGAAPADLVISGDSLFDEWDELLSLYLAIDSAGAAREALTRTLRYSMERRQFGRPIGSFQAYKHRLVDALLLLKLSQSLAYRAAGLEGSDEFAAAAFAAAVDGIPGAMKVCGDAVQLHGGMGFTWEAGIHLLLRRCRANEIIAGSSTRAVAGLRRSW